MQNKIAKKLHKKTDFERKNASGCNTDLHHPLCKTIVADSRRTPTGWPKCTHKASLLVKVFKPFRCHPLATSTHPVTITCLREQVEVEVPK